MLARTHTHTHNYNTTSLPTTTNTASLHNKQQPPSPILSHTRAHTHTHTLPSPGVSAPRQTGLCVPAWPQPWPSQVLGPQGPHHLQERTAKFDRHDCGQASQCGCPLQTRGRGSAAAGSRRWTRVHAHIRAMLAAVSALTSMASTWGLLAALLWLTGGLLDTTRC